MSRTHVKYLLAGGGMAASSAAVAIRAVDPTGSLLMVAQEAVRPYHRSPLSKAYLARRQGRAELFTLGGDWFARHGVGLRTGRRVAHLDTNRSTATLDDGQEISFDQLLLATGATPARLDVPGANLPNLFYVRTLADVDRLGHAVDQARVEGRPHERGRGHVAVVGGGVLGVELAGTLTELGLAVHLIVGAAHPWQPFAGETVGRHVTRWLRDGGAEVINGRRAVAVEGDGRVQRVQLDDGQPVPCDFAVAAVGSVVNRDLLRNTPIRAETAVLVDDHCRTSERNVYAAGDCCAIFDPLFGKHRLIDHWDNAAVTGTLAGTNMAGGHAAYDVVSTFTTQVFDRIATIFGEPRRVYRRLVRAAEAGPIEIGVDADDRVAQTLAVGNGHDVDGLRQLVARRVAVDGNEELLKDPAVPLGTFG